jgi:hypothetical protein
MLQATKLAVVAEPEKPEPYKPVLCARERNAYHAAHRIFALTEHGEPNLACDGGRRSRQIDRIAQIILDAL